jgi:hypothetical protein
LEAQSREILKCYSSRLLGNSGHGVKNQNIDKIVYRKGYDNEISGGSEDFPGNQTKGQPATPWQRI